MAGANANSASAETRQSVNLTVVDAEAFAGREYYDREMARFVAHVRDGRLRPGFEAIRLPGERALEALQTAEENGVPISDEMFETLESLGARHGINALP